MARLQEAKSQAVSRDGREEQEESNGGGSGGEAVNTKVDVRTDTSGASRGAAGNGDNREGAETNVLGNYGGGETTAAAGLVEDEWVEETVEHPAPDYGVDSPVIR